MPVTVGKRPDHGPGSVDGPLAFVAVFAVGQPGCGAQEGRVVPVAALDAVRDAP